MTETNASCASGAEALNAACFCISLDAAALRGALDEELGEPGLAELVAARCPNLFSARPVFMNAAHLRQIAEVVRAVDTVVAQPAYRERVLADAPSIARYDPVGVRGVFFGFDFHLDGERLALIEVNTNAGGALLNVALARAQRACCAAVATLEPQAQGAADFERAIVHMFRREWTGAGRTAPLRTIAIVDAAPSEQYLYPEFRLFQRLFARHGLQAVIAGPEALEFHDGALHHEGVPIDLVYNRLTDFYLEGDDCAALRQAYLAHAVVLTPHPQAYALYADKRRLVTLGDPAELEALGVPPETRAILQAAVPRTVRVDAAHAGALWAARRSHFFKPVSGYGSRAAYRGDKLTKRVWQEILAGEYIAQALVAPGGRRAPAAQQFKFDIRSYVYAGQVQWTAARVYQGQTTNFRTEGGGFAPVYSVDEARGPSVSGADASSERPVCAPSAEAGSYASYVFLLDEAGGVHPLPHGLYVALARAEVASDALAGRRFRLVDWYVRLRDGVPHAVVNESCTEVAFDAHGRLDPRVRLEPSASPSWPSDEERARMRALIFEEPLDHGPLPAEPHDADSRRSAPTGALPRERRARGDLD